MRCDFSSTDDSGGDVSCALKPFPQLTDFVGTEISRYISYFRALTAIANMLDSLRLQKLRPKREGDQRGTRTITRSRGDGPCGMPLALSPSGPVYPTPHHHDVKLAPCQIDQG